MHESGTLAEIVTQLEGCGYRNEAGALEYNAAFRVLQEMVDDPQARAREIGYRIGVVIMWTSTTLILGIIAAVATRLVWWLLTGG